MSALAQRLSMVLGVDAARGEDALVHAVAALRERSEEHDATIAMLADQRDAACAERDEARGRALDLACALECKGLTPTDHGSVHVAALRAARDVVDELRRSGAPDGLDERETLIAERDRLRYERDEANRRAKSLLDRTGDSSPAYDGRAVQALLDAHGYPLREFGPVVRVMRLLGIQGVDLAGDEGGGL